MWHLQMVCSKSAIEVNLFFRPVLNFTCKNLVSFVFSFFLSFFFTCHGHSSDKPTVPDKNTAAVGTLFLCFPFPSQCCLLRFSHQIVYTNIGGREDTKVSLQFWLRLWLDAVNFRYFVSSFPDVEFLHLSLMQSILDILYPVSQMQNVCIVF